MNLVAEYIKFRWNCAFNSPPPSSFAGLFKLKRSQIKIDSKSKQTISRLFNSLENNREIIDFNDFGAGSKKLSNQREIAAVFSTSTSKGKFGVLLFQLSKINKPKEILELGTSLGIGSVMLKFGHPESKVTTVEACTNTYRVALQNFEDARVEIEAVNDTFANFISRGNKSKYDMIFIDGHHDGEALLDYMKKLEPCTHKDTLFILDDIRWSDSMREAWEKIIKSDTYHTTIDFFRMGLVRYDLEREKTHYCLKV